VAIFHLASSRVVLCRHSVANAWFLPKGRRDAGEDSIAGAEREGFEEVSRKTEWLAPTDLSSPATATESCPSP
jgi:8-oxo-dGTP pyrophosphatase MutT (NUDIX family)